MQRPHPKLLKRAHVALYWFIMKAPLLLPAGLLLAVLFTGTFANAQTLVPFTIPGVMNPSSALNRTGPPIETTSPRLVADGSHFARSGERVRIWGDNTVGQACLPTHPNATAMASRFAAAGINCIRLHFIDSGTYPYGIWSTTDTRALDPRSLERLDFYIDQLARSGIISNLNLHVGRVHSQALGLPAPGTDFDKIVGIYTPALIDAQKQYASQLLTHVNAYRGVRYADDPAISIVEISNEDSFFMWDGDQKLRALPAYYADILKTQYNAWLRARYGTDDALLAAWSAGVDPTGPNMLLNPTLQTPGSGGIQDWVMETHAPAAATAAPYTRAPYAGGRIAITNADGTDWHLQFKQIHLAVQGGHYYTVSFVGAADTTRSLNVSVHKDDSPWTNLGLWTSLQFTPDWTTHTLGFTATGSETNARLSFSVGENGANVYLANTEFHLGGQQGLLPTESLSDNSVSVFIERESRPRVRDRMRFLAETEKAYYDGMRSYVKGTLGCGALVTGTIVFGPLGLYAQSDMDFIDSHGYWQHPSFPGTPWDPNNWYVEQIAEVDNPAHWSATLFPRACERLAGKPFTCTEYNHPAPNDHQAECVPMFASFAAAQDWDGAWLFCYGNPADASYLQYFPSWFDNYSNSSKWGFYRAGSSILRSSAMDALPTSPSVHLATTTDTLGDLVELAIANGNSMSAAVIARTGADWRQALGAQLSVALPAARPAADRPSAQAATGVAVDWAVDNGHGFYATRSSGSWAFAGHAADFATSSGGLLTVTAPDFAGITVTPLDATTFASASQLLVTACGRCENTGMVFSTDRRTLTNNTWGHGPVLIEPVEGTLTLPEGIWKCHALGPDGSATAPVLVSTPSGSPPSFQMKASYGTMWYLLERTQPSRAENYEPLE